MDPAIVSAAELGSPASGEPVPRPSRRWRPGRWVLVALGFGAVVLVAAGALVVLALSASPSPIEGYAPRGSAAFAEVRLDVPGDQKIALAQLALRIPGLHEPPDARARMASGLASLTATALGRDASGYAADVRGWLGGALGAAVLLPADGGAPRLVVIAGASDVAAAGAWADGLLAAIGGSGGSEAYRGASLRLVPGGAAIAVARGDALGNGVGDALLAGRADDVRAALDAAATGGLSSTDAFHAARSALPGAELARAFVDVDLARRWLAAGGAGGPGEQAWRGAWTAAALARLPSWAEVRLRAEGDALLLQEANAKPAAGPGMSASFDPVAGNLPTDTVAVLDVQGAGAMVNGWLDALRSAGAGSGSAVDAADAALAGVGGVSGLLAQVGAADAVATWDGSRLAGGLVLRSTDAAGTGRLLDSLRALAGLAKAPLAELRHAGTAITTLDMPGAADLPLVGRPTVEVAMRNDLVVIGVGSGFAESVLDASPGHSLADVPAYRRAVAKAGSSDAASCFVDAQAARSVGAKLAGGEPAGPADGQSPQPQSPAPNAPSPSPGFDLAPALDALEALGCGARAGGDADTITLALTFR